jgi:hypothetical protein
MLFREGRCEDKERLGREHTRFMIRKEQWGGESEDSESWCTQYVEGGEANAGLAWDQYRPRR